MVIFGAGASYDSAPDFPPPQPQAGQQNFGSRLAQPNPREFWRPPLATQLFLDSNGDFGEIVRNYPKLLPILPHLRRPSSGRSVEEEPRPGKPRPPVTQSESANCFPSATISTMCYSRSPPSGSNKQAASPTT